MSICGTNGTIQTVTGIFPKGEKELVRVTFENGQIVECCEDHLWSVTTSYGSEKIITTNEILKDFKTLENNGSFRYKYFIPQTFVEFSKTKYHKLDPYLVGVLIGDGSLCDSGSVELSLGEAKEHIISKLVVPQGIYTTFTYSEESHSFRVKFHGVTSSGHTMRDFLEDIGLKNSNSYTKFIPKEFLLSSFQNRKALLQGLIDTDGHVNKRELFEFSTVSEQLAQDFMFLTRSLGKTVYATIHTRKEGDGSYSNKAIFRFSELKGNKYGNKISNVEKTGYKTEMQCIKVSNADHIYITDDFISTHNTTTATILSYAFVKKTKELIENNPDLVPQKVARIMEKLYKTHVIPAIQVIKIGCSLSTDKGRSFLTDVAKISANGDTELAEAVMKCFDLVGDSGNVTIVEESGPSGYFVNKIEGYPIPIGYEECGQAFYQEFVNDAGSQQAVLEEPVVLCYNGRISDINDLFPVLGLIAQSVESHNLKPNVLIVAHGFSESVLANLAATFKQPGVIHAYPLLTPKTADKNSQYDFLLDIAALSGCRVFDPINEPLRNIQTVEVLGIGPKLFQASRYRSALIGYRDESLVFERVDTIQKQIESLGTSEYVRTYLKERLAKLTSGIARLVVVSPSNTESKEKRDRAEDAICAVRGAIEHGALPGGGAALIYLSRLLAITGGGDPEVCLVANKVMSEALMEPVYRLFKNAGFTTENTEKIIKQIDPIAQTYDLSTHEFVDSRSGGLYDALPAVREAIGNSISVAGLLGACGGIITFPRDRELERSEATSTAEFLRSSSYNEANERP
jgi:chaperonin GroEL